MVILLVCSHEKATTLVLDPYIYSVADLKAIVYDNVWEYFAERLSLAVDYLSEVLCIIHFWNKNYCDCEYN